jgi:hypothetical protein
MTLLIPRLNQKHVPVNIDIVSVLEHCSEPVGSWPLHVRDQFPAI